MLVLNNTNGSVGRPAGMPQDAGLRPILLAGACPEIVTRAAVGIMAGAALLRQGGRQSAREPHSASSARILRRTFHNFMRNLRTSRRFAMTLQRPGRLGICSASIVLLSLFALAW